MMSLILRFLQKITDILTIQIHRKDTFKMNGSKSLKKDCKTVDNHQRSEFGRHSKAGANS